MHNYDSSYHKMWPNKELWDIAFNDALPNKDKTRLKFAVEQQKKELPTRQGPITVDVDAILSQPTFRDHSSLIKQADDYEFLDKDLDFLFKLAELRDVPLIELESVLPPAYWNTSVWLRNIDVDHYQNDFLSSEMDYENLYKKGIIETPAEAKITRTLANGTLRTWAEYVHNDNPMEQWTAVASDLLRRGYKARCENRLVDTCNGANHRFGTGGIVSIMGLYGEALRRLAPISFAEKWQLLRARPEQYAHAQGRLLPQVFPEGSPNHPSRRAMHQNAAQTLAYVTAIVFDSCETFMDEPLYNHLQLTSDNISYARCSAGVHFEEDNRTKTSCRIMAEEICTQVYGEKCTVPERMMSVDYST